MNLTSGIFRRPCYFFLIPFILMFFQPVFSDDLVKYSPEIPDKIIVYGEYPVIEEIKKGFGSNSERRNHPDVSESQPLIDYSKGRDYKEKALIDALHILSANIFGYNFIFKPGSKLMKTEETFEIKLKGRIDKDAVAKVAEGVFDKVYRVKIACQIQKNWAFSESLAGGQSDLKAELAFKVMPDGKISDVWFDTRSGNAYFDESAYKAIMKSNPVSPHPEGLNMQFVTVGIRFNLHGIW